MRAALLLVAGCSFSGPAVGSTPDDGTVAHDGAPPIDAAPIPDSMPPPVGAPPGGVQLTTSLWLVAEDAQHGSDNKLQSWLDRGPNHIDLALDPAATAPVFQPATDVTAPTVLFGSSHLTHAAGLPNTSIDDVLVVAVVNDPETSKFDWLAYTGDDAGNRFSISHDYQSSPNWDFDVTDTNRVSSPADGPKVMIYLASKTGFVRNADHRGLLVNGAFVASAPAFTTFVPPARPFELGDHVFDGPTGELTHQPYDGYLGELYITTSLPGSPIAFEQLDTYFGLRYGITLAHDYLASTTETVWSSLSGYQHNVAGLAIDANARTLNRAASSATGKGLLRVRAVTSPSSAVAYLVFGDDNKGVAFTANRLQRVWQVVDTRWDGMVTIDFAGTGNAGTVVPTTGPLFLVTANNPGFGAATNTPMTHTADNHYTATITFTGTTYLTVATATQ